MKLGKKDILGMQDMSVDEIHLILETAESFLEISTRDIKKVPTLRGKSIINLFYEASTRTRTSFEIAGKRLSADTINISASTSSVVKGETLIDTARTLEAMNPDIIVIRHGAAGAPHLLARLVKQSVINAGDGAIREKKGRLDDLKVAIIGDILHSRVARSNIYGLSKMGAKVVVAGPPTMMPRNIESLGITAYTKLEEAIKNADVIMMLRIQLERQKQNIFPSLREYAQHYCLNRSNISLAKPDVIVMHPGPINRGVEISPDIADDTEHSVILDQVNKGVAVRMALLYLLSGGNE
jgi:aspartate carbamoyltransferase catalytic subunit